MSEDPKAEETGEESAFEAQANQKAPSLMRDFVDFVWHNKAWWLIPIFVTMLLLGVLLLLTSGGSPVAPFIYTLF